MKHICDHPDSHIVRTFDIAAISLPIVYNKYGDHDPNGLLYVLKEDAERIEKEAWERFQLSPPQPYEEVQPPVRLRAEPGAVDVIAGFVDIGAVIQGKGHGCVVVGQVVGVSIAALCQQISDGEGGACAIGDKDDGVHPLSLQGLHAA